jgi:hypothetical protein
VAGADYRLRYNWTEDLYLCHWLHDGNKHNSIRSPPCQLPDLPRAIPLSARYSSPCVRTSGGSTNKPTVLRALLKYPPQSCCTPRRMSSCYGQAQLGAPNRGAASHTMEKASVVLAMLPPAAGKASPPYSQLTSDRGNITPATLRLLLEGLMYGEKMCGWHLLRPQHHPQKVIQVIQCTINSVTVPIGERYFRQTT